MEKVAVIDFGGQYAHLINRRIRELNVYSELIPWDIQPERLRSIAPRGLIFSGGPASVYDAKAPKCAREILDLGIPILGICYGLQLIVHMLGGSVKGQDRREFGKMSITIQDSTDIFRDVGEKTSVWMSHGDYAEVLPEGFEAIANSASCPTAAIRDKTKRIFGLQFHPEVAHTHLGDVILKNFVYHVCECKGSWTAESFVEETIQQIRKTVGEDGVVCAISGGVDSVTTAVLLKTAIGDKLRCIFVDHGLLRKDEPETVVSFLKDKFDIKLAYVKAADRFLKCLLGITDPERKRRVIGEEFIKIFREESSKLGSPKWLAQGTLYPDVIESAQTGSPASRIKSHHNVAGLPENLHFKLLEPLRLLYKDEVRRVARSLGLPEELVNRHPFPGPGLAVRVIGEVTGQKLLICREASNIIEEELKKFGLYDRIWQAFAIIGDDMAVGVLGDQRELGHIVTVRIVESVDGMTADWARLPYELIETISNRITNEVKGVALVSYAISSKPPSTIEPC